MACGGSTLMYCHTSQTNQMWADYNSNGMGVADSWLHGFGMWGVVPLCMTRGGADITKTPLYDQVFTNAPNTSGTGFYHILYRYPPDSATAVATSELATEIPKRLPRIRLGVPAPPEKMRNLKLTSATPATVSAASVAGGKAQVKMLPASGAMYLDSGQQPEFSAQRLQDAEYIERANRFFQEVGWDEKSTSPPELVRYLTASMPEGGKASDIRSGQKSVTFTLRRRIEVAGKSIEVLGDGGMMTVHMGNDGMVLKASKVWRAIEPLSAEVNVKSFEEARAEAMRKLGNPEAYKLDRWKWGYKELSDNVEQDELKLVYQFAFVPVSPDKKLDFPPQLVEVAGQED